MSTPAGPIIKQKNPFRIKVREVAENEGMNVSELLETYAMDSVMPACLLGRMSG